MRSIIVTALAVFVSTCTCINLVKPRGTPKVLGYDLERRTAPVEQFSKRATVESSVANVLNGFYYNMNISIGTPPQPLMASFDTGSSDLVVNYPNSTCSLEGTCSQFGTYDPALSSTSRIIANDFFDGYQLGQEVGDWVSDTVQFAGQTLPDFVLGVGDNDSSTQIISILGVGYDSSVLGTVKPANTTTTLGAMVDAGIVGVRAFSVYLNSLSTSMGSVLFGGIDTSKFFGSLHTFPIVKVQSSKGGFDYGRLTLNLSAVSINGGEQSVPTTTAEFPATVMLDTGDWGIFLPDNFVTNVWKTFNVQPIAITPDLTIGMCNCSLANSSATVDFSFPGLNISLPFSEIVFDVPPQLMAAVKKTIPPGICIFNINSLGPRSDLIFVLGDAFLRSVYYVVDMESNEISLAPMNPNPGVENIFEIAAGTAGVLSNLAASATGAPIPSGTGGITGITATSASPTITATSATPASSGSTSQTSTTSSASANSSKSAGSHLKAWSTITLSGLIVFFGFI